MKPYFAIVIMSLLTSNAHAEMHKWIDANGNVQYSDSVPPGVTTTQTVRNVAGKGQVQAPATYSPKSYVEREAELKKTKQEKEDASQKKARQAAEADTKKQNCTMARENARTLEESARVVTYDANGERTFMDDATREQRLAEARKSITENCN